MSGIRQATHLINCFGEINVGNNVAVSKQLHLIETKNLRDFH